MIISSSTLDDWYLQGRTLLADAFVLGSNPDYFSEISHNTEHSTHDLILLSKRYHIPTPQTANETFSTV